MFWPPLAMASLSGASDAAWARAGAEHVGAAFLGGIAICPETRSAARELVSRERDEFLPDEPASFIDAQLTSLADVDIAAGVNVRSVNKARLQEIARICRSHGAIIEINAHCRQAEMCAAGSGETLLADTDRLASYVEATATETTVSVKVRAEVEGVNLVETARAIEVAGGDIIHVDAMDSEWVIRAIADACDLFVIANNGVRGPRSVREYVDYGADAVSVGRPSDRPHLLGNVRTAVEACFEAAPRQR